jgi:hypothetical protein
MIKFFRKIRQKLLSENRFSKYLIYAVGEIVLVMIGILLALQVNNWNEHQKEQKILNASLSSLKLNLREDIKNLNDQIQYNQTILKAVDFSFRLISLAEFDDLPLSNYSDSIFHVATEKTFFPTTTTFNSMETGTQFQWIKTQDLIQKIYGYYALVDKISTITNENNQFVKNHIEGFTYTKIEFGSLMPNSNPYPKERNPKLNKTSILKESKVFENAIIGRRFRSNGEIRLARSAISKAEDLISKIDEYLN